MKKSGEKEKKAKQEETSMSSTTHTQTKLENSFISLRVFPLSLIFVVERMRDQMSDELGRFTWGKILNKERKREREKMRSMHKGKVHIIMTMKW